MARLDGKAARVVRTTGTPRISGRDKHTPGGIGRKLLHAIRDAGGDTRCGNCGNVHDLAWSDRCEQLLCGECRKLYVRVARTLPTSAIMDKRLGTKGMIVPGTLIPAGDQ